MSGQAAASLKPGAPAIGDVIAGKYRVEAMVGAGGMGVVVSARHQQLGHIVAIKLLTPPADQERREEAIARFLQEAQAAANLTSDHVVRIYDVGTLESGLPFMVMELLVGRDLASLIGEQGLLPEAQAVDLVLQACAGVAEAHRAGVVHRDLKPSNLFVTQRSDGLALVKVLDFGISKQLPDESGGSVPSLTTTRTIMGSPHYMSPEQVRDARRVDARADIWALGVILQELLTGAPPFKGDSFPGVCAAIVVDPPIPVESIRNDLSAEVVAAIKRCLQKDPALRFQTVDELMLALTPFGSRASLPGGDSRPLLYGAQARPATPRPRSAEALSASPVELAPEPQPVEPGKTRVDPTLASARLPNNSSTQNALTTSERSWDPAPAASGDASAGRRFGRLAPLLLGGLALTAAMAWFLSRPAVKPRPVDAGSRSAALASALPRPAAAPSLPPSSMPASAEPPPTGNVPATPSARALAARPKPLSAHPTARPSAPAPSAKPDIRLER